MSRLSGVALASLLLAPISSARAAAADSLAAKVASAPDGSIVVAPPGPNGVLELRGIHHGRPVTLRSADPNHPAVFSGLYIDHCDNLILQNLDFDVPPYSGPSDPTGRGAEMVNALQISSSADIRLDHVTVQGPPDATLATEVSGMLIRASKNVAIVNSVFRRLHNAVGHLQDDGLQIRDNRFENLADDGIRGGGSSNMQIVGNQFGSLHGDTKDLDHPDCIQFWTSNTTQSTHDITVENNLCVRGSGQSVQGIFFGNENHVAYRNLIIRNNVLVGTGYNGLVVAQADGATIEGNVVARFPDITTRLRVINSSHVVVQNNRAAEYGWTNNAREPQSNTNLTDRANKTIGPIKDHGAALVAQWRNQNLRAAPESAADSGGRP